MGRKQRRIVESSMVWRGLGNNLPTVDPVTSLDFNIPMSTREVGGRG
jgi:hypothetical protein